MSGARDNEEDPPQEVAKVLIQVYDPNLGAISWWEEGARLRIRTTVDPEPSVVISGNSEGLTSLARHLLTLAQPLINEDLDIVFDTYCGWLDDGSLGLRLEIEKDSGIDIQKG